MDSRHDVLELARFLTELSVIDYYFVPHKASNVALAALLYSMNEIPSVLPEARNEFVIELQKVSGLDLHSPNVAACRERLHLLYSQGGYAHPQSSAETRTETISPVCVSYGVSAARVAATQDNSKVRANPSAAEPSSNISN